VHMAGETHDSRIAVLTYCHDLSLRRILAVWPSIRPFTVCLSSTYKPSS